MVEGARAEAVDGVWKRGEVDRRANDAEKRPARVSALAV
jgi:hypothetical protein